MGRGDEPSPRGMILVIGYGNTLRGDDAVGPRAASAVSDWDMPGVNALAVHQLTPELAEPLARARLALFVDARIGAEGELIEVRPVGPMDSAPGSAHSSDPRRLLALARMAYGTCPDAWLLSIPGAAFGLGEALSPLAARGLAAALRWIAVRLGRRSPS